MSIRHSRSARLAAAVSSALAAPLGFGAVAMLASVAVVAPAHAQETTTQLTGVVQGDTGAPLAGATVTVTHVPSGTQRSVTTNAEGRYLVSGLRPGGPYTVEVSGDGAAAQKFENVVTTLGQPTVVDFGATGAETLAEVTVTGARVQDLGTAARFDADQIANAPTINRDLKDVVRFDPAINLDQGNFNAISIAGQNTRYNSLTVDGVKQNDDFGLNNSGYVTNRSPISLDAIEQVSVLTSPWDVQYSGFQGGVINVVTKSGTNEFSGSGFYYRGKDSLAGDQSQDTDVNLSFDEKTYGATFGGPILQDKLFFFASYEKFERTAPVDVGPAGSPFAVQLPRVTLADYESVREISQRIYGFDPLELQNSVPEESEKILANIDWNINDFHRARLSYQRTEDFDTTGQTTSPTASDFASPSNWYERGFKLDQYVVQVFSDWTDVLSTEFKYGKKKVDNRQEPLSGLGIGLARVDTNGPTTTGGTIFVGPDVFRHENKLKNEQDQAKFRVQYLRGAHTLSGGVEYEKLEVFNSFVPRSRGEYYFDSIADFEARRASRIVYSNAVSNDATDASALFAYSNTALYLQDRWQVNDEFVITYGVRHEMFSSSDDPVENASFLGRYGFSNTDTLDGRDLTLPRFGFEWTPTDRTSITGGVGLYGGGTPNVWVSNSYSNTGVITSTLDCSTTTTNPTCTAPVLAALNGVTLTDLPQAYMDQLTTLAGTGSVNAIDPDFEIPSSWRYQFGVDHRFDLGALGDGWDTKFGLTYTDVKDAVIWKDFRLVQIGTLPDGRPRYGYPATDTRNTSINDLVLTNSSKGSSLVLSAEIAKIWDTRAGLFDVSLGYAFMDAEDVNSATSSTALSNWDNLAVVDVNNPGVSTSNYEIRHRFPLRLSWRKALFGDNESAVNLFVERRAGRPYSYAFARGANSGADFATFGDPRQNGRQRQLFYVPRDATEVDFAGGLTWDVLNQYILANGLDGYRGQITPRNGFRSPWVTTADLQLRQELPSFRDGHKIVVQFDIINIANLIDKDWGRFEQIGFPYVVPVVAASFNPATGRYTYSGAPATKRYSLSPIENSVWRLQLGLRYQF